MSIKKANVIKIIVCVLMACILLAGNIVMSYAIEPDAPSTDNPDTPWYEWNEQELAEFWRSLMPGYIMAHLGVIGSEQIMNEAYENFVDIVDGLSADLDISYDDWIALHFSVNPKEDVNPEVQKPSDLTVNNYTVDNTMVEVINQAVQTTLSEHPLGFTESYIPSYSFMNSDSFTSYVTYKTIQEIIKNNNGYTFFVSPNGVGDASNKYTLIISVDTSLYPVNFIGTTTGGNFTNVRIEHDWSLLGSFPQNTEGIQYRVYKHSNGVIGAPASTISEAGQNAGYSTSYVPSFSSDLKNISSMPTNSSNKTVFTSSSKNELIYVFATLNAYKNYNSGSPQPYYYGSGGVEYPIGSITSSNVNTSSVNDAYNQIVDNSVTGMTGQEVIQLVDTVLKYYSNGNGGSGNGGGHIIDFSSISDLIASIGALIGELITGLAEGLTNIVEAIRTVITTLRETLTSGIIFEWLTELIAWLPTEIRTLVIALFTLTVIFACIKLVKGIL